MIEFKTWRATISRKKMIAWNVFLQSGFSLMRHFLINWKYVIIKLIFNKFDFCVSSSNTWLLRHWLPLFSNIFLFWYIERKVYYFLNDVGVIVWYKITKQCFFVSSYYKSVNYSPITKNNRLYNDEIKKKIW